ncbi:MFS transporter [Paraburkholderia guartelaensis]|uniref:hypothetical protein n=1 Tax=Paraburkholderia guartelaensis TaxID=2546446 RepID=UPI002AB7D8FF|nr:hypothetical protein [Paraburkholderia guartelaensis]
MSFMICILRVRVFVFCSFGALAFSCFRGGIPGLPLCGAAPTFLCPPRGLSLINAGAAATIPVIWTLPPTFLKGTGAAAGIAMITSLANLGGFIGTYLLGWAKDEFNSQRVGLLGFGVCMLIGCALALSYPASEGGRLDS